jgi:hypothetical protein
VGNFRRWYTYGICAVALQAVAWAVISLLRNLILAPLRPEPAALAFQIAVIVVGGPLYLGHWLWVRRLVRESEEERHATLRGLYLYGIMAGFLGSLLPNLYDVLRTVVGISRDPYGWPQVYFSRGDWVVFHLIAALVLGVLWLYHRLELRTEGEVEADGWATVRRLYVLGFSAAGLTITTVAVINLVRLVLGLFGTSWSRNTVLPSLRALLCQLAVGLPLWLLFWRRAQSLFDTDAGSERESVVRKVYLYVTVLVGSLGAVSAATALLAGWIRRLVRWVPPSWRSQGDYREALSIIIALASVWAYHAHVIRRDADLAEETPQRATVRHIYGYLVTGVGLLALAIGLGGEITVLVNSIGGQVFGNSQREMFSWFTAAIIAGLPIFVIQWRQVQSEARQGDAGDIHALRSVPRQAFLYFFLFVAALVDLGALVFIVYRLLNALLGGDRLVMTELAQSIGYAAIAAAIWISYLSVLRTDRQLLAAGEAVEQETLRLVVIDLAESSLGGAVVEALAERIPGLDVALVSVGGADSQEGVEENLGADRLQAADLILAPWTIIQAGGEAPDEVAQAVAQSPARKLLVPTRSERWEWVGVDRWHEDRWVGQAVLAVQQAVEDRPIKPRRPLGAAAIAWIVVGVLILLSILGGLIASSLL